MKFLRAVIAMLALTPSFAGAVQLELQNKDAVRLDKAAWWNLELVEASNTTYRLRAKNGASLSGSNYGIYGLNGTAYEVSSNVTLTQGACNTLWGSTTNRDIHVYASYTSGTQATSTSASSPSTDISGGTDTTFKIAVDNGPVVSVTLTVSGLSSGSLIAAAMQTAINSALSSAGLGSTVTVAYSSSLYVITSAMRGTRSKVVVTDGASANVADDLKIGVGNAGVEVAGAGGPQLCVSDKSGLTTVGSTAIGSAGYMSCTATLGSTTAVRQVATADLNCSGPVIGTVKEVVGGETGAGAFPVSKFGSVSSTATGTDVDFALPGIGTATKCGVTPTALGTGPAYMKKAVTAADKITVTFDASQTSGTSTISYVCW